MSRFSFKAYLKFIGVFLMVFVPVYLGGGAISERYPDRAMSLYFDWEKNIPVLDWMVWPYLSLYLAYWLPLFHLNADALHRLTRQSVIVLLATALVFLVMPTTAGFSAPLEGGGVSSAVLRAVHSFDTRFNLVPSLHVAGAALVLLACAEQSNKLLRGVYLVWLSILCLSTLFVHQHHLLDLVTGLILAFAARKLSPCGGAQRPA